MDQSADESEKGGKVSAGKYDKVKKNLEKMKTTNKEQATEIKTLTSQIKAKDAEVADAKQKAAEKGEAAEKAAVDKGAAAEKAAKELKASDPEWDYRVVHDPKGTGYSFIEVFDEDGEFVARVT